MGLVRVLFRPPIPLGAVDIVTKFVSTASPERRVARDSSYGLEPFHVFKDPIHIFAPTVWKRENEHEPERHSKLPH